MTISSTAIAEAIIAGVEGGRGVLGGRGVRVSVCVCVCIRVSIRVTDAHKIHSTMREHRKRGKDAGGGGRTKERVARGERCEGAVRGGGARGGEGAAAAEKICRAS